MKKVKILNVFLILLIAFHILGFVTSIYLATSATYRDMLSQYYAQGVFGQLTAYFLMVISIVTILGLFFVQRATSLSLKKGFFNSRCVSKLNFSALFLIISGTLGFIMNIILIWNSIELKTNGEIHFSRLGQDFLILLIGFSLYIIANVIQNGHLLQEDNELTI